MKYRPLLKDDCVKYSADLIKCYKDNSLVFDSQNVLKFKNEWQVADFVYGFVDADDAMVLGIFDDRELNLYGIVIFDNIRTIPNDSVAQVHIVTSREIWGRRIKDIYSDILKHTLFTRLYCEIPQIAHNAIAMCKRLGFKKTGFIPKVLPYINSHGKEKMYDLNIFVWSKNG